MAQRVIPRFKRWFKRELHKPIPLSEDDRWIDETLQRVGLAIGQWMIEAEMTGRNRIIDSMRRNELKGMAWAAVGEYLRACEERESQEAERNDPPDCNLDRYLAG